MTDSDDYYGNQMFLITGASGNLGSAYAAYLSHYRGRIYGLVRHEVQESIPRVKYIQCDLMNQGSIDTALHAISLKNTSTLTLIHTIGKFKFEANSTLRRANDAIDTDVFESNVTTYKNIVHSLLDKRNQCKSAKTMPIKSILFGSLSDGHNIPWWHSYSVAKNSLKELAESFAAQNEYFSSFCFNLGSLNTKEERDLRPCGDPRFWVTPQKVVKQSMDFVEGFRDPVIRYHDIFAEWPHFSKDYYDNHCALLQKWKREMSPLNYSI